MSCRKMNSHLADLLLDPQSVSAESHRHVETCDECRQELAELRQAMSLMDEWAAPEVTPFFDAKLLARLRAEQQAAPASFLERMRARFLFGSSLRMQPIMAGALAIVILAGGGTYADLELRATQPQESATVHDLQSLDGNAQVFQQLDSVDQTTDSQDQN
jgi:anti-sigma factor RsiW